MDVVLKDGAVLCVSDALDNMSSWVAVEQEDWFEEEVNFLRAVCKPGWRAIDVGASHGVYSLALAMRGASAVWAVEPASVPFERLCRSIQLNALNDRVFPLRIALSDSVRKARIGLAASLGAQTECSSISVSGANGAGEEVDLVSLDYLLEAPALRSGSIDFVKIDAEGAELEICQGGQRFFSEQSPLVMLEVNHMSHFNLDLVSAFRSMGYGIYSLVPGLMCLRPFRSGEEHAFDHFALNLFACKDDRAAALAAEGRLIVAEVEDPLALPLSLDDLSELLALPIFSGGIPPAWATFDCSGAYGQALLAWCVSRKTKNDPATRWAFLRKAQQCLGEALAAEDYHPAVTMLAIRILSDLGERVRALEAAHAFLEQMSLDDMLDDRPVPPVFAAFDCRKTKASPVSFLYQSVVEFWIVRSAYSGFVDSANVRLFNIALADPEHSAEIERRAVLFAERDGENFDCRRLRWLLETEENPNREFWRTIALPLGFFRDLGDLPFAELFVRGNAHVESGALDEALNCFRQAAEVDAASAEARYKQGVVLVRLQQWPEAADAFREALKVQADFPQAANDLGLALVADHRYGEAEGVYRTCLAENPDCFDIHVNFANCLRENGRNTEALYHLRQALRLQPDSAIAHDLLGVVLISLARTLEALAALQRAVELTPDWGQPWNNLGRCHFIRGQLEEADRCYRESLRCAPEFMAAWTNRLMICNYRTLDCAAVFDLHKSFGAMARHVFGPLDLSRFRGTREKGRRLRIGFVSGDFRRHSVSYFVEGVLEHFNRNDFQLFAYFNHTPDARTPALKKYFNYWREIKSADDQKVVSQIVDDKIDILFDLSGHSSGNRMPVFAAKPAPVQVSWIGYPNTSGLDTIDYRLTDTLVDPQGAADLYCSERLWRLPDTFLCYSPPSSAPSVSPPPAASNGFITFGSFNTQFKLGDEALLLWSRVLEANPVSRILIKSAVGLSDPAARESLKNRLVAFGVAAERIDVQEARGTLEDHLAMYGSIDIALDPFPYHGTTTTFEALWMGVPVVSLAGDRHASRVGVSILTNAGLADLVAMNAEQYVGIATTLANDPGKLAHLRGTMRERLSSTPLLDAKGMAANLSAALREMWSVYCDSAKQEFSDATSRAIPGKALIKLHVGGREPRVGWKILDSLPGSHVDFVGDVRDLTRFSGESCSEIYCSHVLEHLGQAEIFQVLSEFHRLLSPGGKLRLSVPDIDILAWLFLNPQFATAERFQIMRMIFGGQADEYDFHYIGLNLDFMRDYMRDAGFPSIEHVESHGMFEDTSEMKVGDVRISLNLVAVK